VPSGIALSMQMMVPAHIYEREREMGFKLRQMEVFRAVMLTGTVSGAARMLFVSQPAVSKVIAHTETSLGVRLFDRVSGKLVPTQAARMLYEQVQKVYDAVLTVESFVEDLTALETQEINVGSSPSLGLSLMPRVIEKFQRCNTHARIHFHTTLTKDVPLEILSGKIDLAVTVLPLENPNLNVERLTTGRMVCVTPREHALASKQSVHLADLSDCRTVFYSPTIAFGRLVNDALAAHGVKILPQIDVPRAELACAMVHRGLGVAIVDEFSVSDGLWSGVEIRPIIEDILFDVNLVTPKFNSQSPQALDFIEQLKLHLLQ